MPALPEKISAENLIPMDLFTSAEPIKIDLVYAKKDHPDNIFKEAIYSSEARLSLHLDMARIVISTARQLQSKHGYTLVLLDGLRTTDSETAAMQTAVIKQHPEWQEGPNVLFSKPGTGAHPRGMAIDVAVIGNDGLPIDMGTRFDHMSIESARSYQGFPAAVLNNRKILEDIFVHEAGRLGLPMLPLPAEWWDFRFPRIYYERWAPLADKDLPDPLKMRTAPSNHTGEWQERFDKSAKDVLNSL